MKDELNGKIIEEFVGLRVRMYSLKINKEEMKKAKGVKKNVVKKDISHQDYIDCLFEERKFMHTMQTIRSFKHQLYTINSPLALRMINDTWWMMGLALTNILVCCKYLENLSIIFSETFEYILIFKNLETEMKEPF